MHDYFSLDDLEFLIGEKLIAYRAAVVHADTASISRVDLFAALPADDIEMSDGDDAADSDEGTDADADERATTHTHTLYGGESIYSDWPLLPYKTPLGATASDVRLHGSAIAHAARVHHAAASAPDDDDDTASYRSVASIELDDMMALDEGAAEALLLYLTPDDVLDFQRRMLDDAPSPRAC